MEPLQIPASAIAARPDCKPVSMGPPRGVSDDEVGTAQMLISCIGEDIPGFPARRQYAYYRPTAAEIEHLANGGFIEFCQYGQVVQPFSATVWPAPSDEVEDPSRPIDLTMQWDDTNSFPFVEDENANITGYGHQDPATFAAEINRYDDLCGMEITDDDKWDADHIGHRWAVLDSDGERFWTVRDGQPVTADTPGAFPITTLWGAR